MLKSALLIGLGGFLGSVLRWTVSLWMLQPGNTSFPWGTLTVNLAGSFFIGVLFGVASQHPGFSSRWGLFLATGFCGSFTTFSTFSLESLQLLQQEQFPLAFSYMGISLVAGLALAMAGTLLVKYIG